MKRAPLVRVQDGDDSFLDIGGEFFRNCHCTVTPAGEVTLKELCDLLAAEAENENYHSQTRAAEHLAKLITKHASKDVAIAVLRDIAEIYGGVHRL